MPKIAVVIPLYNEKQQIEKLIAEIIKFYQNYQNSNFTFVLSDDRSTDDTFYILEMRTNKFNNIKVIRNEMLEVINHNKENYNKVYQEKYSEGDQSSTIREVLLEMWQELKND